MPEYLGGDVTDDLIGEIVRELAEIATHPRLFNPYRNRLENLDKEQAPETRKQNLRSFLEAHKTRASKHLWIFEAPRRGAVRTGVPQTAECQLAENSRRLGISPPFQRATVDHVPMGHASSTSLIVWDVIEGNQVPLLWNVCMGLPWKNGDFENFGSPLQSDVDRYEPILLKLIQMMNPKYILWSGTQSKGLFSRIKDKLPSHVVSGECDHPKNRRTRNFVSYASDFILRN